MMWILLQESSSDSHFTDLLQYGVLGLAVFAFFFGRIWAKPAVDSLVTQITKLEQQRDDLLKVYVERVIPALISSNELAKELAPVVKDLVESLEDLKRIIDQDPPRRRN